VAVKSYPLAALPTSNFPYVGTVEVPVPPFTIERTPVTSEARLTNVVVMAPAVALRNPLSEPKKKLVTERFVLVALSNTAPPVTASFADDEVEALPITTWLVEVAG